MILDPAINLPTVVSLVLAVVALTAWLIRMEGRLNSADKDAIEAKALNGALEALVALYQQQFHQYRLEAAEKYMTQAAFGEIKRELVSEINRMEGRLEAQIERIGNRPASSER